MNLRQRHALLHPYEDPEQPVDAYRTVRVHRNGFLLVTVLAVDR